MSGNSAAALAVGLAAAALAGTVAPGMAAEVSSGNDSVSLTLSGQINRGLLYADDGANTALLNVDNDNSSTRVRFVGVGNYDDEISIGTVIEVQFESNSTANIKIDGSAPGGSDHFTERKLELYFDHKRYGRIWLGQGDTASNGTSEVDLSGTSVINYSGIADMAGGIEFGGFGIGPQINQVFSNFDGLSRDDRIRYDTPNFGGFSLAASYADSRKSDVALRFAGDIGGGLKLAGAIAYAINGVVDSQINGSASLLHDSGFNVTGAAGVRDIQSGAVNPNRDPFFWYAKLGYIWGGGIGNTAFAIDYTVAEEIEDDLAATGDELTSYGIFAVQKIDKIGTELYFGVRNHELDRVGQNFDDVFAVLGGARIKF
jgi:predicted porin